MKTVGFACLVVFVAVVGYGLVSLRVEGGPFIHPVPFTCQAPYAQWNVAEYQDGCEEASGAMALSWARGERILHKEEAKSRILALCRYEEEIFGFFQDTGVDDTTTMLRGFWGLDCSVLEHPTVDDLKKLLTSHHVVVAPINGKLKGLRSQRENGFLNYELHKMDRHMMLLVGYNDKQSTFIVHDPATRNGAFYEFDQLAFVASICDYPSRGNRKKQPIKKVKPRVIMISRKLLSPLAAPKEEDNG